MKLPSSLFLLGLFVNAVQGSPVTNFQSKCEALADGIEINAPNEFEVKIAQFTPRGTTLDPDVEGINATCLLSSPPPIPVDVCRLGLEVRTSPTSSTIMELWMPEVWEGRILSTGTGGVSGCISYADMAFGSSYNFAVVGHNSGHNGTSGGAFFHQPEVLADWMWRSVYTSTVIGKDITQRFYAKKIHKSYYLGCSNGGRQGFKAVQDSPDLFDGVVVGAPVIKFDAGIGRDADYYRILNFTSPAASVNRDHWAIVTKEVLRQCDHLDGAVDGILEYPQECHPDLSTLLCNHRSHQDGSVCLTHAQLHSVNEIYATYTVRGERLYPGLQPGAEVSWYEALMGGFPSGWATDWFGAVIYQDLSWQLSSFTEADTIVSVHRNVQNIRTYKGDLSAFRDAGGKVLHWHGEQDEYIVPTASDWYYRHVQHTMGASTVELDEFYRYFRISGTGHCAGGTGACFLGQSYGLGAKDNPENNLLLRIVDWVENGRAPETVRGTKFVNNDPTKAVEFARKHCKFPARNVYHGTENGSDEDGWQCIEEY